MVTGTASPVKNSRRQRNARRQGALIGLIGALVVMLITCLTPRAIQAQGAPCATYDSQVWAQSDFDSAPAQFADLDPDSDGIACQELPLGAAPAWWTDHIPDDAAPAVLVGISDGDTIRVKVDGRDDPLRLILIDTPETHDPNDLPECYGQEATAFLTWLLSLGGDLYLENDVTNRDRYDRLLRYVWLDLDGEVYLVNEAMVRSGYAAFSIYPPDLKYVEEMREASRFAREHGYGLWSGCETTPDGDTNELDHTQQTPVSTALPPVAVPPGSIPDLTGACEPAYPSVCIPPSPPDLDCGDIMHRHFEVNAPDPHQLDGNADRVGCER